MGLLAFIWEYLGIFLQFLVERRADDKRIWDYAVQIQANLESPENKEKTGEEKYQIAFGMLKDYATALGLDLGGAAYDSILAICLPAARKKVQEQ